MAAMEFQRIPDAHMPVTPWIPKFLILQLLCFMTKLDKYISATMVLPPTNPLFLRRAASEPGKWKSGFDFPTEPTHPGSSLSLAQAEGSHCAGGLAAATSPAIPMEIVPGEHQAEQLIHGLGSASKKSPGISKIRDLIWFISLLQACNYFYVYN